MNEPPPNLMTFDKLHIPDSILQSSNIIKITSLITSTNDYKIHNEECTYN